MTSDPPRLPQPWRGASSRGPRVQPGDWPHSPPASYGASIVNEPLAVRPIDRAASLQVLLIRTCPQIRRAGYTQIGQTEPTPSKSGNSSRNDRGSFTAGPKNFGPVVTKTAPAATLYRRGRSRRLWDPVEPGRNRGGDGVSETMWACLRRHKLIHSKVSLFVAEWACLWRSRLVCCKVGSSTAISPYPGQNKLIHGKTRVSGPNQAYPRQNHLIYPKVGLFGAKSTCLA